VEEIQNNDMNKIIFGDCRESMRQLATDGVKVQMCVTSPPYYNLRDYGHDGQIGMEKTPEQYIEAMVEVFRCVKNILADDGVLWVNIGDSYARNGGGVESRTLKSIHEMKVGQKAVFLAGGMQSINKVPVGLKEKDLIGIPWMLAFALRADGWYLRQDIIWHKPNPMPESVTDRCTKAHEYIFLLSKSPKYFYDNDAIKEPAHTTDKSNRDRDASKLNNTPGRTRMGGLKTNHYETKNKRSVWTVNTKPYKGAHFAVFPEALIKPCILAGSRVGDVVLDPFMGSGTTAQVALQLGRKYLGCELNPSYKDLQDKRVAQSIATTPQVTAVEDVVLDQPIS
jgi:DNA modification methylase